jgi:hypothetical protein
LWKNLWENSRFIHLTNGNKDTYQEMNQSSANDVNFLGFSSLEFVKAAVNEPWPEASARLKPKVGFPQLFRRTEAHYIWCGR